MMSNRIKVFFQCGKCTMEKPAAMAPRDFARFEVGWTVEGLQVWCKRHECNVVALEFGEPDVRYAPDDEDRAVPTRVAK